MSQESLQNLAYCSIVAVILYTIPQLLHIIKNKQYYYMSNTSLILNIFIFGVFVLYAKSFDDNVLSILYAILLFINIYMFYLKNKNDKQ